MEIIDLTPQHYHTYFHCLEEWSDDIKEAGDHKSQWFFKQKDKGLRVKLAVVDGNVCGMIQYLPVEHSTIQGDNLYFITCIWVHGHKQGIGNYQGKGIGKALLQATEKDVRSMGKAGIASWGLSMPFWMKASWYKKQGYKKVDKDGIAVLLWKPFTEGAIAPQWIKLKKQPQKQDGKVTVTAFINGWCPAQNMVFERAKRASGEFGEWVEFQSIDTSDRKTFAEWGLSDALFIDGKSVRTGPPPSYEKLKKKIGKRVKKIAH